jgi:uncharacterized protein (DUF2147 family)
MLKPFHLKAVWVLIATLSSPAYANGGIDGLWQQIDDKTGKLHSLLRIETINGEVSAALIEGYPVVAGTRIEPDARCIDCPGEFNNKPLYGLRIMWGLKKAGDEWAGGHILDPEEKQIYNVQASLSDSGAELNVRGYIGVSLFGRTQVWRRYMGSEPKASN